jgi:hypothetical protein
VSRDSKGRKDIGAPDIERYGMEFDADMLRLVYRAIRNIDRISMITILESSILI